MGRRHLQEKIEVEIGAWGVSVIIALWREQRPKTSADWQHHVPRLLYLPAGTLLHICVNRVPVQFKLRWYRRAIAKSNITRARFVSWAADICKKRPKLKLASLGHKCNPSLSGLSNGQSPLRHLTTPCPQTFIKKKFTLGRRQMQEEL